MKNEELIIGLSVGFFIFILVATVGIIVGIFIYKKHKKDQPATTTTDGGGGSDPSDGGGGGGQYVPLSTANATATIRWSSNTTDPVGPSSQTALILPLNYIISSSQCVFFVKQPNSVLKEYTDEGGNIAVAFASNDTVIGNSTDKNVSVLCKCKFGEGQITSAMGFLIARINTNAFQTFADILNAVSAYDSAGVNIAYITPAVSFDGSGSAFVKSVNIRNDQSLIFCIRFKTGTDASGAQSAASTTDGQIIITEL